MNTLSTALELARRYKFRVMQLAQGNKKPLLANWQERASSDPDEIRAMWARAPRSLIAEMREGRADGRP